MDALLAPLWQLLRGLCACEAPKDNPYANVLAVRKGDETRPEVQALVRALQSEGVRKFIESTDGGSVVPAF